VRDVRVGHRAARSDSARAGTTANDDRGVGLVATAAAFVVFLVLLLLAVQVLYGLYATSVVRGVLNDAASRAANDAAGEAELERLADDAERSLGRMGDRTTIQLRLMDDDADGVADVVAGSAVADPPRFVPPPLGGVAGLDDIDVAVRVRIERFG
jgi:Flp pilus assembly protein TadG